MRSFNFLKVSIVIAIFSVGIFAQEYTGKLVELNGQKVTNSKAFIGLKFRTGGMTGNAGCNRMFGSFSARGNSIRFSGIGTTRMFCTKSGGCDEAGGRVYARPGRGYALPIKRRHASDLCRAEAGAEVSASLRHRPGRRSGSGDPNYARLEDRKWVLDKDYSGIDENSSAAPFINFDKAKGSAGGNTGCNVFGGSYSVTGAKIVISEIISTMRACIEDDRMDTERKFLDGLRKSSRFEIRGEELSLYQGPTLLLRFRGRSK